MKRLGEMQTKTIVGIIAFVVLGIVVFSVSERFEVFYFIADLFGFDAPLKPAQIVGIDLKSGELQYLDVESESWKNVPLGIDFAVISGELISPEEILKTLNDFYLKTERRPRVLDISASSWRRWIVNGPFDFGKIQIMTETKKGFVGEELKSLGYLDYSGVFEFPSYEKPYLLDLESSLPALQLAIDWRDQILGGKTCEKFLTFNLKETGSLKSIQKKFSVRKEHSNGRYLFVDFSKPVFENSDKWTDVDCFNVNEYNHIDRVGWENGAVVEIRFTDNDGVNTLEKVTWEPKNGWKFNTKENVDSFGRNLKNSDFYYGLVELTKSGGIFEKLDATFGKDFEGVFIKPIEHIGFQKVDLNFPKLTEWGEFGGDNEQIITLFNYRVLDKYNQYILSPYYFDEKGFLSSNINYANVAGLIQLKSNNQLFIHLQILRPSFENPNVPFATLEEIKVGEFKDGFFYIDLGLPSYEELSNDNTRTLNIVKENYESIIHFLYDNLDTKNSEEVVIYNG